MDKPNYELTEKQKRFVEAAEEAGFNVDYGYSGRGMYGRQCPAVRLKEDEIGSFGFPGAAWDSMGRGQVIYCK